VKIVFSFFDIKLIGKKILFFCLTFSLCFTINGQTEAEILDKANKFFKDEKFVEATPLYLRLLSLQPKNIDYNYRYGTCLLFNSNKKQESLRYLKFATENEKVNPEAYFYMGRSYHLNYLFNDAVRSYDKYARIAGQKEAEKQDVAHLIQMCQDGRRLLMNYSEMVVYDKKEIEADKFFRLYDLKDIGGSLLVTTEFQSKTDKKEGHIPLIYFPNSADEIYYSSFGESNVNGKEIYRRIRKPSGGWGEPELVKGIVNTKYDEDFAYRSQDGKYLYFCSKGHNSMGGYDVFRSLYDKRTDSFIETENMDFAISSPDDDIFFLVDKDNQNGYFASARQSETGKLFVYKIRIEKLPTQLSIIAGTFVSKINQNSKISVDVQELATGKVIGNFTSKDDGTILITFPLGGEFKYIMKIGGDSKVFTQNVTIPMKKNIKPLRQNLVHFTENGEEVVRVLDRFDEVVLEKDDIVAALFSEKARLDPNVQQYDLDKLNRRSNQTKILTEISAQNLTLSEVAADLINNARTIKKAEIQSALFEQKTTFQLEKEMKNLQELDGEIIKNAFAYRSSTENSMSRQDLLLESKKLVEQRAEIKDRIEDLVIVNEKVQENAVNFQELKNRASEWENKGVQISKLLAQDKNEDALEYIEANKVIIRSGMTEHATQYQAKISKEISDFNSEITELIRNGYNYETSAKDLQNNIDYLERQLFEGNTKGKEVTKENIALKKADFNLIKAEVFSIQKDIQTKREIKENLIDELAEFMSVENSAIPKTISSYQNTKDMWILMKNAPISADYELLARAIETNGAGDIAYNKVSEEAKDYIDENVLTQAIIVQSVDKTYEEIFDYLNEDIISDQSTKLKSLNQHDTEFLSKVDTRIKEIKEVLKTDSAQKPLLTKELQLLSELKSGKEFEIEKRNNKISEIENQLAITNPVENIDAFSTNITETKFADLTSTEQELAMLDNINSNYTAKKEQIENSSLPDDEKVELLTELNEELISEIKTEKRARNKKTELNEIAALDRLTKMLNQESKQIEVNILAKYEEPNVLLSRLSKDYLSKIEVVNKDENLDSIEKAEQEIGLKTELVDALQKEKGKFEKLALANPTNEKVVAKIQSIDQIQSEYAQILSANLRKFNDLKSDLALNPISNNANPTVLSKNVFEDLTPEQKEKTILEQVAPNYFSEKSKIEQSAENEKTKYLNLLALDNKLASKLADEKENLDKIRDVEEIEAIKIVEVDLNAQIENNQLNLFAAEETSDELITRLAKDYLRNKEQLASNQYLTEVEKAKRQLAVDQFLLETLEKEKEKFANLSSANPQNKNVKAKETFIFNEIVAKQNEMSQLSAILSRNIGPDNLPIKPETTDILYSVDDLRKTLLRNVDMTLMESQLNSKPIDDLKEELVQLEAYEKSLRKLESDLKKSAKLNTNETKNKLKIIGDELMEVDSKKRQYTIAKGELESELLAQKEIKSPKVDSKLEQILEEEKELVERLDGEITSMREIRKIEKQLRKLGNQKSERKSELLALESKDVQKENENKLQTLTEIQTSSVSERINKELAVKRSVQLSIEADGLAELAKKSKNKENSIQLFEKALVKEKLANEILEIALVDNIVEKLTEGKISTLSTKDELEQRKKYFLLQEAGYNSEIKNINEEIKLSKNSKDEQELILKRNGFDIDRLMIIDQIAFLDKKIGQLPSQPLATIPSDRKDTELTYQEEFEISSSIEYKEISKSASDVLFIENEITFLLKSIDEDKLEAQKMVELALIDGNKNDNSIAEEKVKEIQAKEQRFIVMKKDLSKKQMILANLFPSNPDKVAKIENLLLRSVDPIRTEASNYIAIPDKGFEIDLNAKKKENKELAVDTKVPTGLMFRVQVGAFSRPVAEDAFQEFNPVTGEKRSNGLTVYMAGFFNKSTRATEAQKTIRGLGYTDAFVVAYCDGERIPLVEGRKMEESKSCVPIQLQDLTIKRIASPKDTTKRIAREFDYVNSLGAAPASPIELKKGLFYTVQIGVYNKPVDLSTIKNLTPLITKRLANGQIRYSAGVYVSIEEAMPKRKEAIEKGISDAYITAYYRSERISLSEAEQLLQDRGIEIIEKTALGIVKDVKQRIVAEEKLKEEIVEVEKKIFEEGMGIQLVSKETFNEFPRDMLNRFNRHVSFYFDQNDKRLKSFVFTKEEDIPQIHFLRYDVDTVFIPDFQKTLNLEKERYRKIVFSVKNGQLEGDVADFIYRLNYRKEYFEMGESMKVTLHNVPSNSIQFISDELRNLKIRSVVE
jgi:hypothetical protein